MNQTANRSIIAGALLAALAFNRSAGAVGETSAEQASSRCGDRHRVVRKVAASSAMPPKSAHSKPPSVAPRPYRISGVFLTDLRGRGGRAYPRTAPAIAHKYPGADLLVTVVADGKVILPPRALRLKLPLKDQTPKGAFVEVLRLSSDGMRLAGLLWHGDFLNSAYKSHMDLCVLAHPDGRMRRLTRDTFFSPFHGYPLWEWSPDHRQIAAVEIPDTRPIPYDTHLTRLVVFDTRTGTTHTLSEQTTKKEGTFIRFLWVKGQAGERGVAYQVRGAAGDFPPDASNAEIEKSRVWAWFFVPVPARPDAEPGPARPIADAELADYSISRFPAAVIEAQKKLRYDFSSASPRDTMAVFHRDDSGVMDVPGPNPDGFPPWITVEAGRTAVVDAAGKKLMDRDDKEWKWGSDWSWDGLLLTSEDEDDSERRYSALDPRTGVTRQAVIPAQVPSPWHQWLHLSPTAARRAAAYWRRAPNR
ncbi:MAG: hypothetical protein H8F28_11730 [Fibrella sp.]|nr:hypothetical protein [Armatimonadota bacterium]